MLALASVLCAAFAAYLWTSPATPAHRLARLLPAPPQNGSKPADTPTPVWLEDGDGAERRLTVRTVVPALGLGLIVALLVGGIPGIVAALLATPVAATALHRREPPERERDRIQITADLPFAADLMSACLLAGRPTSTATETAATAVGGPLGLRLTWAAAQLRLGADPEPTWAHLSRDPATAPLARAMIRAAQSGAPVADVLTRLADDARESSRAASVAAARAVGVKAVAPLGLCFLPAFVLLGIIPVVAGLAATIVLP